MIGRTRLLHIHSISIHSTLHSVILTESTKTIDTKQTELPCFVLSFHRVTDPVSHAESLLKLRARLFSVHSVPISLSPQFTVWYHLDLQKCAELPLTWSCHFTDPVLYAEGLLKLKSQHRLEQANLENQLDAEHAQQLAEARAQVAGAAEEKLSEVEREAIQRMQAEGERLSLCEEVLGQERERPSRECRLKVSDSVFVKGFRGRRERGHPENAG